MAPLPLCHDAPGHSQCFPHFDNGFCGLQQIVLLKQMIAGTVVKKKNDCKESTYPEPVKKAADLSAFLCETTASKTSEMFPC